jgi:hypothetical protein
MTTDEKDTAGLIAEAADWIPEFDETPRLIRELAAALSEQAATIEAVREWYADTDPDAVFWAVLDAILSRTAGGYRAGAADPDAASPTIRKRWEKEANPNWESDYLKARDAADEANRSDFIVESEETK